MEKTLTIDGKQVRFKSTGGTPLRYKAQFGKDFFAEILQLNALGNLDMENAATLQAIDFEVFYNIAWTLAKTADQSIPDPLTWLDQFGEFPIMEIIPELQDMILATLQTKKK
ncbi:hypothetical protein P4U99_03560 [Brevibacillus agri]|uniref:hypothetical protein n=1 Tax=Brevibacillus TaxID=55080 RepID=UPI000271BB89|nr:MULTISPECIES: hypothetical protein [Brevibacillus]EJL44028.1 hypothetical protein PMI08_02146 [Brevibacillus sp. CF112]MBG9567567.1 prophage pi2 protein 40 [Brevibacillus agri]MBG9567590.1 prophage pi2 protein 40 [Brevibacillus agri]MED1642296.1 hypothetical protein [Brevibacillus agri]MED1657723.1 hypothetical protein [Brevibacillus agri]